MRKSKMAWLVFSVLLLMVANVFGGIEDFWRSADPCQKWIDWSAGDDALVIPALKNGLATHDLSPAEIIFLSAKENGANPVLMLAILEDQQCLVSIPVVIGTFEKRLFLAMGFAIDENGSTRYGGFFPQLVAASFQMLLGYQRETPFADFYERYFRGGSSKFNNLEIIYSWYVREFFEITGVSHSSSLNSQEVYIDFQGSEMNPMVIQMFLKKRGSVLNQRNLFRQLPVDDSVDYQSPQCEK